MYASFSVPFDDYGNYIYNKTMFICHEYNPGEIRDDYIYDTDMMF